MQAVEVVAAHSPLTLWRSLAVQEGIVKAAAYFRNLDLGRFKKPTKHTAHQNTDADLAQAKKKQKTT